MPGGEDLDAYFDPSYGMGVAAVYDGGTPVNVVFDNDYDGGEVGVAGTAPRALGKASVFPAAAAVGKTLLIEGVTYVIRSPVEPVDDGSIVRLNLKRQ